ncbi:hypothetical protein HUW51_21850 [Adhaeribacter swui]|uniref:PE-PGRS family protein n=1 Tax=Adhaeribacter swui TaxID=2086471 RepID=A0A7G7GDJ8_9BACT|nr:hypothetical protein [Adhaeribacter swui]QNF35232.1 hypothetical protein HUW51_21850 [Adhaeribacter swui]
MKTVVKSWGLMALLVSQTACDDKIQSPFSQKEKFKKTPTEVTVTPIIEEASGIADSKTNPGKMWVQEDSGRPNQLYLLDHNGTVVKQITIKGAVNRDWEEMALSNTDVFIGDIGDNDSKYPEYTIYQFAEPAATATTVDNVKKIKFKYPDGSHDAEAFLVDPTTQDIYIITKRDSPGKLYRLTAPFNYAAVNTATLVGTTKYSGIVAAAISPDGKELLLKTYTSLYYYARPNNETLADALQRDFTNLPYNIEPQGEAITFATDNSGFFTLSEKGLAQQVKLYFYGRE